MKIQARIEVIKIIEEPLFNFEVETESIEDEVARLRECLNPDNKYKIGVTPTNIPDINLERLKTICPVHSGEIHANQEPQPPYFKSMMGIPRGMAVLGRIRKGKLEQHPFIIKFGEEDGS